MDNFLFKEIPHTRLNFKRNIFLKISGLLGFILSLPHIALWLGSLGMDGNKGEGEGLGYLVIITMPLLFIGFIFLIINILRSVLRMRDLDFLDKLFFSVNAIIFIVTMFLLLQ